MIIYALFYSEYNYHRTKLEENENGDLKCVLCGGTSNEPQSIADFGTDDMSILKIPIMKLVIIHDNLQCHSIVYTYYVHNWRPTKCSVFAISLSGA